MQSSDGHLRQEARASGSCDARGKSLRWGREAVHMLTQAVFGQGRKPASPGCPQGASITQPSDLAPNAESMFGDCLLGRESVCNLGRLLPTVTAGGFWV